MGNNSKMCMWCVFQFILALFAGGVWLATPPKLLVGTPDRCMEN